MPNELFICKRIRALKECSRRKTFSVPNRSTTKIPPGGKARLEIQIRGPPQAYLVNDISQILATGLVLSTNFGGVMPIFVEFEALQGQLYGSLIDSSGNESAEVDIPVHLSWDVDRERIYQARLSMQQQNCSNHFDCFSARQRFNFYRSCITFST